MHFWSGESAQPALLLEGVTEDKPLLSGNLQVVSLLVGAATARAAKRMVANCIFERRTVRGSGCCKEGKTVSYKRRKLTNK